MKRLLCILSSMNAGGAETFLMKLYRCLDRDQYQMDFCINTKERCFYEDEIIRLGGRIYRIPSKSEDLKGYKKQLSEIVSQYKYLHVLRITSNAMGFLDLKIAKKAGAQVCIARSSNASDGGGLKIRIAHRLGKILYKRYVDVRIAPSDLAAKYTFGEKAYMNGEVLLLHNGVDLNSFRYDANGRKSVRNAFGISEDTKLIGHVGRFNPQKNHSFLLDIFQQIDIQNSDCRLLLVGAGDLEQEIRTKVHQLQLDEKVIFAGIRRDVPQLMSAMDVFVFPSFYEGMPNTVIEAQACGLQCIIADTITKEAKVTDLVSFMRLSDSPEKWAQTVLAKAQIQNPRDRYAIEMNQKGYGIKQCVDLFTQWVFNGE